MSTVIIYYPQGHYKQLLSNPVNIHLTSDRLTARICINISILNNENKLDKSTYSEPLSNARPVALYLEQ